MQTIKSECAQSLPHNNHGNDRMLSPAKLMPGINVFYCYYRLIKVTVNVPMENILRGGRSTREINR